MEEEFIPQGLRDAVDNGLAANLKEFRVSETELSPSFMGTAQTNIVNVYQQNLLELLMLFTRTTINLLRPNLTIWNNDFLNAKIVRERAYLDSNARDRSASKGYGFGNCHD